MRREELTRGGMDPRSLRIEEGVDRFRMRSAHDAGRPRSDNVVPITGRLEQRQHREPCVRCGARFDTHDQFGCKRWVSA